MVKGKFVQPLWAIEPVTNFRFHWRSLNKWLSPPPWQDASLPKGYLPSMLVPILATPEGCKAGWTLARISSQDTTSPIHPHTASECST